MWQTGKKELKPAARDAAEQNQHCHCHGHVPSPSLHSEFLRQVYCSLEPCFKVWSVLANLSQKHLRSSLLKKKVVSPPDSEGGTGNLHICRYL